MKNAELVIIETYNYKLTNSSLKYYQMCAYMEKLGFSPIELVGFRLRKHDDSFGRWIPFLFLQIEKSLITIHINSLSGIIENKVVSDRIMKYDQTLKKYYVQWRRYHARDIYIEGVSS